MWFTDACYEQIIVQDCSKGYYLTENWYCVDNAPDPFDFIEEYALLINDFLHQITIIHTVDIFSSTMLITMILVKGTQLSSKCLKLVVSLMQMGHTSGLTSALHTKTKALLK